MVAAKEDPVHRAPEYVGPPNEEGAYLDVARYTDRQVALLGLDTILWVRKLTTDWVNAAAKTEMQVGHHETRLDDLEAAKENSAVTELGRPLRDLRKDLEAQVRDPANPLTRQTASAVVRRVIKETRDEVILGRVAWLKTTLGKGIFEGIKVVITLILAWAAWHFTGWKP